MFNTNKEKKQFLLRNTILASALSLSIASNALATFVSTSGTMQVTANVVGSCSMVVNNLNFGNFTGVAAIDANTTIIVTCSGGIGYKLGLDGGANAGGATNINNRKLKNSTGSGGELLPYQLYKGSDRTSVWGYQTNNDVLTVASTTSGTSVTNTVYGRLFSAAVVKPGAYTDVVNVTLTYYDDGSTGSSGSL